jgi:hypothetical protein
MIKSRYLMTDVRYVKVAWGFDKEFIGIGTIDSLG